MGRLLQFSDGILRRKFRGLLTSIDQLDFRFLRFFTICAGCGAAIRPHRGMDKRHESLLCSQCLARETSDDE